MIAETDSNIISLDSFSGTGTVIFNKLYLCKNGELYEKTDKFYEDDSKEVKFNMLGVISKENIVNIKRYLVEEQDIYNYKGEKSIVYDFDFFININIDGNKLKIDDQSDNSWKIYMKIEKLLKKLVKDLTNDEKALGVENQQKKEKERLDKIREMEIEWDYNLDLPKCLVKNSMENEEDIEIKQNN